MRPAQATATRQLPAEGEPRDPTRPTGLAWLRGELAYRPLLILIGIAITLRVAALALYFPAVVRVDDSLRFALVADHVRRVFDDYWMPAAYPIFLGAIRLVSDQLWLATAAQHLLGLVVGTALYLALRRLEVPRLVALVPAAVYLLSGDVLFLEHLLMADQLAMALTTLALCAAVFGLRPRLDPRWLALAGVLAAGAWLTRSPFVVVVVVLAVVGALAVRGTRRRAVAAAAVVGGAAVVLGAYVLAFEISGGRYLGLSDMKGWQLHSRVAPFAVCSEFDVPEESAALCDETLPDQRRGPFFYVWSAFSTSLRNFEQTPETDGPLWAFATAAIRGQPRSYADAVIDDLARYVHNPLPRPRNFDGNDSSIWSFSRRVPYTESIALPALAETYSGVEPHTPGKDLLAGYQDVARLHGILIVALLALALAGGIWGRGRARPGIALFGTAGLLLYLAPVATAGYDFRYGIPPSILLACAGTLGAYSLWLRRAEGRETAGPSAAAS